MDAHGQDYAPRTVARLQRVSALRPKSLGELFQDLVDQRPSVAAHSLRVGAVAHDLAAALGWGTDDRKVALKGGWFHDVGKIDIPIEILEKPSQLSLEEELLVRRHPSTGAKLVRACTRGDEISERVAIVIEQHHERLDGKGYPCGLLGPQIDPVARLIAVVDAYFAMTEGRPYMPTLTSAAALAELQLNAGTQFDPMIVEQFMALYMAVL